MTVIIHPTPRKVESIDEIRPGQWVALQDEHHARAGKVTERRPDGTFNAVAFPKSDGASGFGIHPRQIERGELVILSEPPPTPLERLKAALDGAMPIKAVDSQTVAVDKEELDVLRLAAQAVVDAG